MITDERTQQRKITIDFALAGYKHSLDEIIDPMLPELQIVLKQRELHGAKIKITLE